jgi:hypothetical protein
VEVTTAEAIGALQLALVSDHGVGDALRVCWHQDPAFSSALMEESVRLRFGTGCNVRLITAFVARIRTSRDGPAGAFPSREAEALIRANLGELALLDAVDPARFNYPELGITIMGKLFEEWRPSPREVEDLFEYAKAIRRQMTEVSPLVALGEEGWIAAGMPGSPFAAPSSSPPPPHDEDVR